MKFKDLLKLKSGDDLTLRVETLKQAVPNTPLDVIEQFYSDHGLNSEFQSQYAILDINNLIWSLESLEARTLILASVYNDFNSWFTTCSEKSKRVGVEGDYSLIHNLDSVSSYWKENKTWNRPPIFLAPEVLSNTKGFHLVEGHSRLGALKGLVDGNVLSGSTKHMAWIGRYTHA